MLLPDAEGADPRAERYVWQLLGAGLGVLEVLPAATPEQALACAAALAADDRIQPSRLGILAFGAAASAALAVRCTARALLYPHCATIRLIGPDAVPLLLLHGDADRANPAETCMAAADALGTAGARVRRIAYAGATAAWDYPPFGLSRRALLPGPNGQRSEIQPWPELAAMSATVCAGFFSSKLRRPAPP